MLQQTDALDDYRRRNGVKEFDAERFVLEVYNLGRSAGKPCRRIHLDDPEVQRAFIEGLAKRLPKVRAISNLELGTSGLHENSTLDDWKREAVNRTLAHTRGNKSKAARILGINIKTLSLMLKRWEHREKP